MGASNSHLEAYEFEGETARVKYGVYCMPSNCQKMEDEFSCVLDLDGTSSTSFFGVYGGHGGPDVAKYCAKQFHIEVVRHEEYQDAPDNALKRVFFRIDDIIEKSDQWRAMVNPGRCTSCLKNGIWPFNEWPFNTECGSEGTTACVVLIKGKQIMVGNVGDSQCLLSVNGQVERTEEAEFLVIASNGLWKCRTHEIVANAVCQYLLNGETDLRYICKQVCLSAANTYVMRDNMTMILVQFKKDGKSVSTKDKDQSDVVEAKDPNRDMQGASDDELQPLLAAS